MSKFWFLDEYRKWSLLLLPFQGATTRTLAVCFLEIRPGRRAAIEEIASMYGICTYILTWIGKSNCVDTANVNASILNKHPKAQSCPHDGMMLIATRTEDVRAAS